MICIEENTGQITVSVLVSGNSIGAGRRKVMMDVSPLRVFDWKYALLVIPVVVMINVSNAYLRGKFVEILDD
jgi:hypothetical protein